MEQDIDGPADPVAIVTGAARGLGRAISLRLVKDGWRVVGLDVDPNGLGQLEVDGGSAVRTVVGGASDRSDLERAAELGRSMGTLVGGVANAGIVRDARIARMTETQWDDVISVDLSAGFLLANVLMPHLVEASFGRLLFMSSIAKDGNFGQANYAAAKAGLVGLAKSIAVEGAAHRVTANVICPGVIMTPGNQAWRDSQPAAYDRFINRVPARRVGDPDDIAAAVAFFFSREASYITGQVLYVDGGMSSSYLA